ncbi:branched-chain amino acid ABC transporter permease [Dechloromonas agitata]|uniref:branched-chain amino acid ABC transporter permease n=1 Tax=Dechloromonas agitata TaxID=73030 RepID=UPI00237D9935|nr:branched-chain amino acid ABC transporter permease [Dechloromonas agitata]MDE1544053.1 branched-chain amino acid ABC transporter permease [Dechloromonas agitata]
MNFLTRRPVATGAVIFLAIASVLAVANDVWLMRLSDLLIWILFAASLNFLISFSGMVSFGHAAYFGLGCYGFALAAQAGAPISLAVILGPVVATVGAAVYGTICVRLNKIYFAMLTLACAEITYSIIHQWYDLTGGDTGLTQFAPPLLNLGARGFAFLALACCAGGLLIIRLVLDAPLGLVVRSVGENPDRAAALGFSQRKVQWVAFVIAGFLAGVAGTLYSAFQGNAFPDYAGMRFSLTPLVMVILGGLGSFAGPIVGAVVDKSLVGVLSHYVSLWELIMGVIVIAVVVYSPHGFWGLMKRAFTKGGPRG